MYIVASFSLNALKKYRKYKRKFCPPHFYRTPVRSLVMLVTHSLTHSRLVNLIDVALACEDAHSKFKLVEVVTAADDNYEDRVGNRFGG